MSVSVSVNNIPTYNSTAAATQTFASLVVNTGDTLALFTLPQDVTQTITSVTWDQGGTNQACTLVGSEPCPTAANGKVYIYAVVNPTAGTKSLQVVQSVAAAMGCIMQTFKGTITTSVAAACTNALVANGTTGAANAAVGTAAQSGSAGNAYVSGYICQGGITTTSDFGITLLAPGPNDSASTVFVTNSGGSHSSTFTVTTSGSQWAAISCNLVEAAANVDFDSATTIHTATAASITINDMTVGTASNRALFLIMEWNNTAFPTGVTAVWDSGGSNQSMTLVSGTNGRNTGGGSCTAIYSLVAPVSGNKTLLVSWTGSIEAHAMAMGFSNVNQSTPTQNGNTNYKTVATAPPATITITSASTNMVLTGFEQSAALFNENNTGIWFADTNGPSDGVVYSYTGGAASITASATWTTTTNTWSAWGCDIVANSGVALNLQQRIMI
jgi:hypothetical protein